jgi:hypothetical protein
MPMPTHADVMKAVQSVPTEDGVIVFDAATGKTLAYRAPADPPSEHSALLIAFNVGPLSPADPRFRAPSQPPAPPSDPDGGSAGGTERGAP